MDKNKIVLLLPGDIGLNITKTSKLIVKSAKFLFPSLYDNVLGNVTLPLSLLAIKPYIEKAGFEVVLIDGSITNAFRRLDCEIDERVLYVGISCLTGQISSGLQCAEYIRQIKSNIPLVWGGVHVTLAPEQALITSNLVDIVVRGEGEYTSSELAKCLSEKGDLSKVKGISYKSNQKIVHNEDRPFLDFSNYLGVDYDAVDMECYNKELFLYQSERGCPHRCAFCDVVVVHRKTFRTKNAKRVLLDLKDIQIKYKPKKIQFVDDCFFADMKRAKEIINGLIEMDLGIVWHTSCRAQYFRKTDVNFWQQAKKAGLNDIYVGTESGSQRILDYIKKDCTTEDIYSGLEQVSKAGIVIYTNLMSGFPMEEKEDIDKSINFINDLRQKYPDDIFIGNIFLFSPYPGTALYQQVVEAGFIPPSSLYEWGQFRRHRSHTNWHPLINYIWVVSTCFLRAKKITWFKEDKKRFSKKIRSIKGVIALGHDLLQHIIWCRWKHRFFKWPIDIRFIELMHELDDKIKKDCKKLL